MPKENNMVSDVALYPGDRATGKTFFLLNQIKQSMLVGQSVAVLAATNHILRWIEREIRTWSEDEKFLGSVYTFTEPTFYRSRGLRLDHIYVDNADLFEESPADYVSYTHPGVPFTMTYTPSKELSWH